MKKRIWALVMAVCMMGSLTSAMDDEIMRADAAERTLNIVTTFGTSEVGQYGVPNAFIGRYDAITEEVSEFYASEFGITVNFSKPAMGYVVASPADTCKSGTTAFNTLCSHAIDSACKNSGPFHHTNCQYMTFQLYPASRERPYGLEMHFTSVNMCVAEDEHFTVAGATSPDYGTLLVRDWDYASSEYTVSNWLGDTFHNTYVVAATAHEIGHLYGVVDHYDQPTGTNKDLCIWGYFNHMYNVSEQLLVCDDCRAKIQANSRKYNF